MKVVSIKYPTVLSKIEDIENCNIDVIVTLEDEITYTVVVWTPRNFYWYMEKENKDYFCGSPPIIVKKLTHENIAEAINEYASGDAYWLKYYALDLQVPIEMLDEVARRL